MFTAQNAAVFLDTATPTPLDIVFLKKRNPAVFVKGWLAPNRFLCLKKGWARKPERLFLQ